MTRSLPGNNGRVGIYGISYPGFYSAASLPDAHPALKAVSPQAPISDFFFDDFHHMGAYLQSYTAAFAVFGYQKKDTTRQDWYAPELMRFYEKPVADGYDFHLQQGPLSSFTDKYHHDNFFWKQIIDHPNYDSFWQKRSLLPHLTNIKPAVFDRWGMVRRGRPVRSTKYLQKDRNLYARSPQQYCNGALGTRGLGA